MKTLYRGHVPLEPIDRKAQSRGRPDPRDIYFPPDDGYPRLKFKSHEILWLLSRGVSDIDAARLVGCHRSYPGGVKARFALLSPEHVLRIFASIPWPHEL